MGSGKTTLGKELSSALGCNFLDMDALLEKVLEMSIGECFDVHGEEFFRFAEHELLSAIVLREDAVVSTGGGTPCYHDNMKMMKETGRTVYLKVSVDELYERLKDEAELRPLLRDVISTGLKERISKHLQEREKFYLQADIIYDPVRFDITKLIESFK